MKEIPLTTGGVAIVDDEDYESLIKLKWHIQKFKNTSYARTYNKGKISPMHRIILGVSDRKVLVDHIDRNGLNNQRSNLRVASVAQNNANRKSQINSSSRHVGVSWVKRDSVWRAYISCNGSNKYLGDFKVEADAALAYNNAAKEIHGEFASLNALP